MEDNKLKIIQFGGKSSTECMLINGVEIGRVKDYKIHKNANELAEVTITFDVKEVEIAKYKEKREYAIEEFKKAMLNNEVLPDTCKIK